MLTSEILFILPASGNTLEVLEHDFLSSEGFVPYGQDSHSPERFNFSIELQELLIQFLLEASGRV